MNTSETLTDHVAHTYTLLLDDVEKEIQATSESDAERQAEAWARDGDWSGADNTFSVTVWITDVDGNQSSVAVTIVPDDTDEYTTAGPFCFSSGVSGHQNPGAHGGVSWVDTRSDGATRRRNTNGVHEEVGPWELLADEEVA